MSWPMSQDYNEAIQSPALCFSDAELRQAEAVANAIGVPRPYSGNFADVYEMHAPDATRKWAVKCFTRQVAGLRERYAAISAYLKQVNLPFMVDFTYLEQGIKVAGQWYPVLKMHWVEGFTLNTFVGDHADDPPTLDLLAQIWVRLARRLREGRLAHCDLQHGNVLLVPGTKANSLAVRLIDYDGMCVPALVDKKSGEVGHPAYQHPQRLRDGTYSVEVDRFPHLVIYTALRALMVGGRYLWNKYDNGDNLLFRQSDLEAPDKSPLFTELRKRSDGETAKLVKALATAVQRPLEQAALLDELVPEPKAGTPRRKSGVVTAAAPGAEAEASPEAIFAAATAGGDAAPAPSRRSARQPGKGTPWLWTGGALGVVALGLIVGGVLLLRGSSKSTEKSLVAAAGHSGRKDPPPPDSKLVAVPPRSTPKIEPKVEPGKEPEPKMDFDAWLKQVAEMPAAKQVEAVAIKLKERNPGFDGQVTHKIEGGVVTELAFSTDNVTDISPVRALTELRKLRCNGTYLGPGHDDRAGKLADLSPLTGMKLTELNCGNNRQVSDLSPLKDMKLTVLWCKSTAVSDLSPLKDMKLTSLHFGSTPVTDLSPLKNMPLTELRCDYTQVSDLSALKGMKLTLLSCAFSRVADLTPLKDMPLTSLNCRSTPVSDMSPLKDMKLTVLSITSTKVTDLSPLKGMPLKDLNCDFKPARDAALLRSHKTLEKINNKPAREFWKDYDALQAAFDAWSKPVAAMPAAKQVDAVAAKLKELNPGFDGQVTPKIEGGVVTELEVPTDNVTDISPVRALTGLQVLNCDASKGHRGKLDDLWPLKGMKLTNLRCNNTPVADLSPLKDMPLTSLHFWKTQVADLAPLKGMPLTSLHFYGTPVADLSPLKDMKLTSLNCNSTQVSDLTPLKDMKLTWLACKFIKVTDLSPLRGLPLKTLWCDFQPERDAALLRSLKTLEKINDKPATEFWKVVDAKKPGPKPVPEPKKERLRVPDATVQAGANKVIKELFKADYAKKKPADLLALAGKLFAKAKDTKDDATARFVFYRESSRLAALAGDADMAVKPLEELAKEYVVDGLSMMVPALTSAARATTTQEASKVLVGVVLKVVEEALEGDDYKTAFQMLVLAGAAAKKAQSVTLVTRVATRNKEVLALKREHDALKAAAETLHQQPDDPGANLVMGKFTCFVKGKWDKGLPMLVKGSDEKLKALTEKDLAKPTDGVERVAVGDGWWEWADKEVVKARKDKIRQRAVYWYKLARPALTGAALTKIDNLVKSLEEAWIKSVAALPAEDQVDAVAVKLMELNPDFNGKVTNKKIEKGVVTVLSFATDDVTDISPVRALKELKSLSCKGNESIKKGKLADLSPLRDMSLTSLACDNNPQMAELSPLQGMPLTSLYCQYTRVADLSSLKGMPLTRLGCSTTKVADLSPLQGMLLTTLSISVTPVTDLSALKGMPLTNLSFYGTQVADLSPLKGMPLTTLNIAGRPVADLSLLKGMPLTQLIINGTSVVDLSPLVGMNLQDIRFTPKKITTGMEILRQMKTLKTIGINHVKENIFPAVVFWKKYDAGEFK